jgi:ribosomal protein S1
MALQLTFSDLVRAHSQNLVLKARIVKAYYGSALVSLGGHLAVLSKYGAGKKNKYIVDSYIDVFIIEINDQTRKVFVTDRNILVMKKREIEENFDRTIDQLAPGQRHTGLVTNVLDYGLFVSIDGAQGLVHISEISWKPKKTISTSIFTVGQKVDVIVKAIDKPKKRIVLSIKDTIPDPVAVINQAFEKEPEKIYAGRIMNTTEFGTFVQLAPGADGLLHISDMTLLIGGASRIDDRTENLFKSVINIPVKISAIDLSKRRISLKYAGKEVDLSEVEKWPSPGKILNGEVKALDLTKARIAVDEVANSFVYEQDNPVGFSGLVLRHRLRDKLTFQVLGFDFATVGLRLKYLSDDANDDGDEYNFIVENFLAGRSYLDLQRRIEISNPYFILARHLEYFKGIRLSRTFDYIYHFGHISGEDAIRTFGLLHRASVEFRLFKPELALALLGSALRDAIKLRRRRLVQVIIAIISKQSHVIWLEDAPVGNIDGFEDN